jgi:DNA-binding MarR family transcriptional regulator
MADADIEAVESLIWETRRLFRVVAEAADEALQPLHITASERALIEFLARESGPISVADLARKRSVSRQHIHQSLERLRNPKWIDRRQHPNDARSVMLRLTEEGRSLWKQIRAADRTILRRIARHIDPAKAQAAAKALREIREALQEGIHD